MDGFRLGPTAPAHRAVVDGDTKSAAIAAASIVAKVTRDRVMRRLDALYPRYGFARHVGYITPGHSAAVRAHGPSEQHRRSFQALCYLHDSSLRCLNVAASNRPPGHAADRRPLRAPRCALTTACAVIAARHQRLGGRQRARPDRPARPSIVFCEVKGKATTDFGHPLEMVTPEKRRRLRRAAEAWFARHPECRTLDCRFEVVAVQGRRLERFRLTFDRYPPAKARRSAALSWAGIATIIASISRASPRRRSSLLD